MMDKTKVGDVGFVGDLNGECFPALNSQVNSSPVNELLENTVKESACANDVRDILNDSDNDYVKSVDYDVNNVKSVH